MSFVLITVMPIFGIGKRFFLRGKNLVLKPGASNEKEQQPVNYSSLAIFTLLAAIFGEGILLQFNSKNQEQGFKDLTEALNQSHSRVVQLESDLKVEESSSEALKAQVAKLRLGQNNTEKRFNEFENTQKDIQTRLAFMTERQQTINVLIANTLDTLNESQIAMHDEIQSELQGLNENQNEMQDDISLRLDELEGKQDTLLASLESGFQEVKDLQNTLRASFESQIKELGEKLNAQVTFSDIQSVIKKVAPSTGSILIPDTKGGASLVIVKDKNGKQFLLTCAHNFINGQELAMIQNQNVHDIAMIILKYRVPKRAVHVKLYSDESTQKPVEFQTKIKQLNKTEIAFGSPVKNDVALLEIPKGFSVDLGISLRDLKGNPLKAGDPVVVIGNSKGFNDSVSFGIVSNTTRNEIEITGAGINLGNSGAGVFDMEGRLIGILEWVIKPESGSGISGVIKEDTIVQNIEKWETLREKYEEEKAVAPSEPPK